MECCIRRGRYRPYCRINNISGSSATATAINSAFVSSSSSSLLFVNGVLYMLLLLLLLLLLLCIRSSGGSTIVAAHRGVDPPRRHQLALLPRLVIIANG
jgi:hypothetical protein